MNKRFESKSIEEKLKILREDNPLPIDLNNTKRIYTKLLIALPNILVLLGLLFLNQESILYLALNFILPLLVVFLIVLFVYKIIKL